MIPLIEVLNVKVEIKSVVAARRGDIQYNDTQHSGILHTDTHQKENQHNERRNILHNDTQHKNP